MIYNILLFLYACAARVAAHFNQKVSSMVKGQKETFGILEGCIKPDARYIWFHAASLGEFEQGRPLIEEIRKRYPQYKILQTFFSPSGYEVRKDYKGADVVCYLPFDTPGNVRCFLDLAHPCMAFFIKYEFWQNYLTELSRRRIPVYSVSSIFRPDQVFFKWYGRSYRNVLSCFDTIAGYQEHGAIVHYEATPETSSQLKAEGLLLLDSGAQYLDGTTDITRTISLGPVTEEQKKDYTLVLKGFIALSTAEFPHGTCGTQLDILARQYMWKDGINYGHGTGHGVGHFLNVHEGPHQIRMNYVPAPLLPGMTITNEPGIYKAGKYGIRTENTMLVVPSRETEFGVFYKFEPLTLCPIDQEAILPEMLTTEEKAWLNQYHKNVYEALNPMLSEAEKQWLRNATLPLS
jgi:hypothetical protein